MGKEHDPNFPVNHFNDDKIANVVRGWSTDVGPSHYIPAQGQDGKTPKGLYITSFPVSVTGLPLVHRL